jgi:hypothetical protein
VYPPSTIRYVPVMYEASSQTKKRIAWANYLGSPTRLSNALDPSSSLNCASALPIFSMCRKEAGVKIVPGHTQFTRIPNGARSMAMFLVIRRMGPLLAL